MRFTCPCRIACRGTRSGESGSTSAAAIRFTALGLLPPSPLAMAVIDIVIIASFSNDWDAGNGTGFGKVRGHTGGAWVLAA